MSNSSGNDAATGPWWRRPSAAEDKDRSKKPEQTPGEGATEEPLHLPTAQELTGGEAQESLGGHAPAPPREEPAGPQKAESRSGLGWSFAESKPDEGTSDSRPPETKSGRRRIKRRSRPKSPEAKVRSTSRRGEKAPERDEKRRAGSAPAENERSSRNRRPQRGSQSRDRGSTGSKRGSGHSRSRSSSPKRSRSGRRGRQPAPRAEPGPAPVSSLDVLSLVDEVDPIELDGPTTKQEEEARASEPRRGRRDAERPERRPRRRARRPRREPERGDREERPRRTKRQPRAPRARRQPRSTGVDQAPTGGPQQGEAAAPAKEAARQKPRPGSLLLFCDASLLDPHHGEDGAPPIDKVLAEAGDRGDLVGGYLYGDWRRERKLRDRLAASASPLELVEIDSRDGTGACRLAVDAMEASLGGSSAEGFVLVISDPWLTPLVHKLQDRGHKVLVCAPPRSPLHQAADASLSWGRAPT